MALELRFKSRAWSEMDGFPELTIGEVARRAGVATSSIRYYERIGLLPEPARSGAQRRYDADVLGKLGFIGVAQNAGFKLREIKQLIDGADGFGEPMRSLSSQKLAEVEIGPGEAYVIEPGHDAWVIGDERFVGFEFEQRAAEEYAKG